MFVVADGAVWIWKMPRIASMKPPMFWTTTMRHNVYGRWPMVSGVVPTFN